MALRAPIRTLALRPVLCPARAVGRSAPRIAMCAAAIGLVLAAGAGARADAQTTADAIYYNGTIVTMNDGQPTAQAVAVAGTKILGVGSTSQMQGFKGASTKMVDLAGKTLLPGFIDAHSHLAGYGLFNDPENWTDVSSVNMYGKPLPTSADCKTPLDPQYCFIPVRSQDDVVARLTTAIKNAQLKNQPAVLVFNYDPARLGPSKGCDGAGFACPTFENGKARETLDTLSTQQAIYVESESGHVAYVNTKALAELNICGTDVAKDGCYKPNINTDAEQKLANLGQLDEDLTFYATTHFQGPVFKKDPAGLITSITRAAKMYAAHGFTLTQEGAATGGQVPLYQAATREPDFPTTAALVMWEATKSFEDSLTAAIEARKSTAGNPRLFVAAVKTFADGSPQALTGAFYSPYTWIAPPFSDRNIFPVQPYAGLVDVFQGTIYDRLLAAHDSGFPLMIHQNGDAAVYESINALQMAQRTKRSPTLRDIVLHAPMLTPALMTTVRDLGNVTVSFLMDNLHYWGQPLCQQVLGPTRAQGVYPAATTARILGRLTMHHDSPVTPPDPLFAMWVAKTRKTQQMPWYPAGAAKGCPEVFMPDEIISIRQGLKAYTIDAAWQYNLDTSLGSIETGKTADFAILSANPLDYEQKPDGLLTIKVMATVSQGRYLEHIASSVPPSAELVKR